MREEGEIIYTFKINFRYSWKRLISKHRKGSGRETFGKINPAGDSKWNTNREKRTLKEKLVIVDKKMMKYA